MANNQDKREKEQEEERRKMEERRALLKMKQGIIEESELIPEDGYEQIPELHGWAKIKNFFYHYKVLIIVLTLVAAMLAYIIVQSVNVERNDLYVLLLSTDEGSELAWQMNYLETALEEYCPDFDNNGYVHVGIVYIDISSEENGTYYMAQLEKLSMEMSTGDGQLIIGEESMWERLVEQNRFGSGVFMDLTEEYPGCDLYKNKGIYVKDTPLDEAANWKDCPENVVMVVRAPLENGAEDSKEITEQRERALTVVHNIMTDNKVNPVAANE